MTGVPTTDPATYEKALTLLAEVGQQVSVRGHLIALYLGLRRMRLLGAIEELSEAGPVTSTQDIERFLDDLYEKKIIVSPPFVVLTAMFGQSKDRHKVKSYEIAPGNKGPSNNWRNNFNIQKGVGCPASPEIIRRVIQSSASRASCEHFKVGDDDTYYCSLKASPKYYRDLGHSIFLRKTSGGNQVTDLDEPTVYDPYLVLEGGARVPIFPLLSALYSFTTPSALPVRDAVTIHDFASDFGFSISNVHALFDCDPESPANAEFLSERGAPAWRAILSEPPQGQPGYPEGASLPAPSAISELNTGVAAEIAVGRDLEARGWEVTYYGNQHGLGYDLVARTTSMIYVEVKSSVSICTPELTDSEWAAAQRFQDSFWLAVVDYVGTRNESIQYVWNPAQNSEVSRREISRYRISRASVDELGVSGDFV